MGIAHRLSRFTLSQGAHNRHFRATQSFALVQVRVINSTLLEKGDNNELEINYLWDHSSEYAYSVFCGLVATLFL